jgi:hypothetical protein
MRKLDLSELRVETFATQRALQSLDRHAYTEQQYCTIGNPPADAVDQASRTACPYCCV